MNPLDEILAKRRALRMGVETWEMYKATPNWMRERILAVNHFSSDDNLFEIAEVLLSEAVDDGGMTSEHLLSLLVNSNANRPLELDMGLGKYTRPNEPGSLIFTNAGVPSEIKGKGPFHSITFYIRPELLQSRIEALLEGEGHSIDVLHTTAFRDEGIEILLKRLLLHFQNSSFAGEKMTTQDLVDGIVRRLLAVSGKSVSEHGVREKLAPGSIQRALDYLHAHFREEVSRDDLALAAGVNPSHFTRLFGQTLGMTPRRYLLKIRIDHARELFKSGDADLTLDEVACQCGFYDQSHFGMEFRKQVGITPNLYRAYMRK